MLVGSFQFGSQIKQMGPILHVGLQSYVRFEGRLPFEKGLSFGILEALYRYWNSSHVRGTLRLEKCVLHKITFFINMCTMLQIFMMWCVGLWDNTVVSQTSLVKICLHVWEFVVLVYEVHIKKIWNQSSLINISNWIRSLWHYSYKGFTMPYGAILCVIFSQKQKYNIYYNTSTSWCIPEIP